jgi:aryl-alcohol dehydrogenase-like predicted oxidoreductase
MKRLALGTAQFGLRYGIANKGGQVGLGDIAEILALSRENNVDTLDTAIAYGQSETSLGGVGINGFKVVTKLPAMQEDVDNVEAWVREQMKASLARLGVTRIYGLLLHRAEQLIGPHGQALARALQALKEDGLVVKVGVSIYEPEQLASIIPVCMPDLVQAPLNLLDRRLVSSGWLQRLHDSGVEVHTRSAFLQGLLLMPRVSIPFKFERWSSTWDIWREWLTENTASATRTCLQYPLSFPQVSRVVVGVDTVEQFKELLSDLAGIDMAAPLPDFTCTDVDLLDPSKWNQARS